MDNKITTLAERIKGKSFGESTFKMLAKEAKDFVEQAHEMEAKGNYEKAAAYCEAACEDLELVYENPEEFELKSAISAVLDSTRFTQYFFSAKMHEKSKQYGDALKDINNARKVYEKIMELKEPFNPSFNRYLDELESLEQVVKVHEKY